ncbi:sigma 54-interacting transcriptional regulator [Halorhodospira halochloris]|uniref:sigma-54 dependent transcriptional regulator n=1 Tax=Halorhodospira halochloris TaxID=1052 RepID=UPI003B75BD42
MGAPILAPVAASSRCAFHASPGMKIRPPQIPLVPGWHLELIHCLDDINYRPPKEIPSVGLMQVNPINFDACHELLTATEQIEWIALVDSDSKAHTPIMAEMLSSCFFDFHTIPADPQLLALTLGHAAGMANLRRQARSYVDGSLDKGQLGIFGDSPIIKELRNSLAKVARNSATVLIHGESGSGKELAAQAIHDSSQRYHAPFVIVNCGAIPTELVQSELFGHERGAFTGAHQRRTGHLERANGGTILLDEIGELSLEHQVSLLRVLEERAVTRVGGSESIALDVRVIAATHVDLAAAVEAKSFREDLYYRLNVLRLDIPPLRERGDDIIELANLFLERFQRLHKTPPRAFSPQSLGAMRRHQWPGNVRELRNRIERAVVMSNRIIITPEDLGLEIRNPLWRNVETLKEARAQGERAVILRTLANCSHNISAASRQLGISRVTLYRTMRRLGVRS